MSPGDINRALPHVDVPAAAATIADLLDAADRAQRVLDDCRAAIADACDEVWRADLPQSWIPLDLDPDNVLVDDDDVVRFIDLDDSFTGPVPLAIATFARRVGRCAVGAPGGTVLRDAVYRAYEDAWPQSIAACDWSQVDIAALVIDAYLGLVRVKKHTERQETDRSACVARHRRPASPAAVMLERGKQQTSRRRPSAIQPAKGGDKP